MFPDIFKAFRQSFIFLYIGFCIKLRFFSFQICPYLSVEFINIADIFFQFGGTFIFQICCIFSRSFKVGKRLCKLSAQCVYLNLQIICRIFQFCKVISFHLIFGILLKYILLLPYKLPCRNRFMRNIVVHGKFIGILLFLVCYPANRHTLIIKFLFSRFQFIQLVTDTDDF